MLLLPFDWALVVAVGPLVVAVRNRVLCYRTEAPQIMAIVLGARI